MSICFARKADCVAIAEIYNHAVLYTAAIWNDQTVDADNRIAWFEARTIAGYPVLVSEEDGVVTDMPRLATGVVSMVFAIPWNIRFMSIPIIRAKVWGVNC